MVEALVSDEQTHLRVVRPQLRLLPALRTGISRELRPSESLKAGVEWTPKRPVSLGSLEAVLYATSTGEDRRRCDAEYKPELRAFERLLAAGKQHDALGYQRVTNAWHDMLANPAVSDRELESLAIRSGINEEGEKHLLARTDI